MLNREPEQSAVSPRLDAPAGRWAHALRLEWLGQTAASLIWIASVMSYGISELGDWLQLLAASAWLVANIDSLRRPHD